METEWLFGMAFAYTLLWFIFNLKRIDS